jgi:hypothetical protein
MPILNYMQYSPIDVPSNYTTTYSDVSYYNDSAYCSEFVSSSNILYKNININADLHDIEIVYKKIIQNTELKI